MRALCWNGVNDLRVETVPDPAPPDGGVVVRVEACGVCRSDWHAYMGHDPTIRPPHVPGHELAGTIAELGLDLTDLVEGPVGLDVATETRRSGQGRATIKADLRNARMMIAPLAWAKPAGQNAGAEVVLRLNGETLLAMDSFQVDAPALRVRGAAAFGRGARMGSGGAAFSENSSASFSVITPPSSSASTMVTARR